MGFWQGLHEQFEFIITFLATYQYLSHLEGITVKLQSTSLDIFQPFHLVEEVKGVTRLSKVAYTGPEYPKDPE